MDIFEAIFEVKIALDLNYIYHGISNDSTQNSNIMMYMHKGYSLFV